ncbi:putative Trafficking protein particle complex subunit 5 [Blattamonas nauphoetae]|uniref:Trafficking protein particle complex subunit 5 n=1 Tax=Blattamonas nauphoetae TaxID=2049346 RepID=A0ABQ9YK94_9EUKA|nr:putative Trafficking protein particle complex subunit 5 [Blattamonas nauphoetae]
MSRLTGQSAHAPLEKPIGASPRGEVNVSAFGHLYCAAFDYCKRRCKTLPEISAKLESLGYDVGHRTLELLGYRTKEKTHETRISTMFTKTLLGVWNYLFTSDYKLLKYTDEQRPYGIRDSQPLTNLYMQPPAEWKNFDPSIFIAGIIKGVLCASDFPCIVLVYPSTDGTVEFIPTFEDEVLEREKLLAKYEKSRDRRFCMAVGNLHDLHLLRLIPGVPLVHLNRNVMVLEKPSLRTLEFSAMIKQDKEKAEAEVVQQNIQRYEQSTSASQLRTPAEEAELSKPSQSIVHRHKKAKGPNPLAIKKKAPKERYQTPPTKKKN